MALLEQLAPEFERTTGHRIVTTFDVRIDFARTSVGSIDSYNPAVCATSEGR